MPDWRINLLDDEKKRRRARRARITFFIFALCLAVSGASYLSSVFFPPVYGAGGAPKNFLSKLKHILPTSERRLKGERSDRINILILGMGGPGHEGPLLTDTIIIASLRPSDGALGLISVPRDLAVTIPGHGTNKINHANAFGEASGDGLKLARATVETTFGQTIHYVVRVDFDGFKNIIDMVGGIPITVERAFEDSKFPVWPKGTTPVRFEAGPQHMDGATALTYARSRHGSGGEGSDFARARRQQQVMVALRDRVFSKSTLLNPLRAAAILDELKAHLVTDAALWEMVRAVDLAKSIDTHKVKRAVLSPGEGGLLSEWNGPEGYFLVPRTGHTGELKELARDIFTAAQAKEKTEAAPTAPNIVILNGTFKPGLAAQIRQQLEDENLAVAGVDNTTDRSVVHSRVYVRHGTVDPNVAQRVARLVQAPLEFTIPEASAEDAGNTATLIVVIGIDHPLYTGYATQETASTTAR